MRHSRAGGGTTSFISLPTPHSPSSPPPPLPRLSLITPVSTPRTPQPVHTVLWPQSTLSRSDSRTAGAEDSASGSCTIRGRGGDESPGITLSPCSPMGLPRRQKPQLHKAASLPVLRPRQPFASLVQEGKTGNAYASCTPPARIQGGCFSKLSGELLVLQELREFGATGLPLHGFVRKTLAWEVLAGANKSGEIRFLSSALRSAKTELGLEVPLVQRSRKLLCEAQKLTKQCHACFLTDSFLDLPKCIAGLEASVPAALNLALGDRLFDDPWLRWGQERLLAWRLHKGVLQRLAEGLLVGPEAYSIEWARLALGNSTLRDEFGSLATKALAQAMSKEDGPILAKALKEVAKELGFGARDSDAEVEAFHRLSSLLAQVDDRSIDGILLGCLRAAAEEENSSGIFGAVYKAVSGKLLFISEGLQVRLQRISPAERSSGASASSSPSPSRRATAARLGAVLQVPAEELCFWRRSCGGLALRLGVVNSSPDAATARQRLLDSGLGDIAASDVVDGPQRLTERFRVDEELFLKLLEPGPCIVKDLASARMARRRAEDALSAAIVAVHKAEIVHQTAEMPLEPLSKVLADAVAVHTQADDDVAAKWKAYCAIREKVQEATADEGDDPEAAEELYQKLQAQLDDAQKVHQAAKAVAAEKAAARSEAEAEHTAASVAFAEAASMLQSSRDWFVVAEDGVAAAIAKVESLRRTPVARLFDFSSEKQPTGGRSS